jgi:CheY-like chemotaxis protein
MDLLDAIRRRLILWLGGEVAQAPVRPATAPRSTRPAAAQGDGPIFDPTQSADAPFEPDTSDGEPYPNDRRLKHRRNARAGTRVLLVDDSPTIVALLRKLLRQNGYDTLEAGDAEAGIRLARETQPDLIFLDIVLPGMDGFAALRTLRRDPLTRAIPIIMISGNTAATEQFYVQRIGADDFMKKPFARAEVFNRIEQLLDPASVPRRVSDREVASVHSPLSLS